MFGPWVCRLVVFWLKLVNYPRDFAPARAVIRSGKRLSHSLVANYQRCSVLARVDSGIWSASLFDQHGLGARDVHQFL